MADLTFNCPLCGQNLTTDEGLSGSEIECPSCTKPIKIPSAGDENVQKVEAEPTAPTVATEPEPKKLAVPAHGGSEILLKKERSKKEEEITGDGKICVKTIKRGDCIELGLDKFDESVNKFLEKFSREQIVSLHSLNYSHFDPTTQKYLPDYAAMIVYQR
jgi:ribosomal protein S27E